MAASSEERDINGMASCLSEGFQLHQSPDLPYGGTYKGHSGFKVRREIEATQMMLKRLIFFV